MFRRITALTLIIFVLSLCAYQNVSYAGPSLGTWINADKAVDNAYKLVTNEVNLYHAIRSGMETLISDWNRNQTAIQNNNTVTLIAAGGVIVSGAVAIATAGSLYPAAYLATVTALKTMSSTADTTAKSTEYTTSMSTMLTLMDKARANVDAAYSGGDLIDQNGTVPTIGYDATYDQYMAMGSGHVEGYPTADALAASVKGGKLKGYFHSAMHAGDTQSNEDHVFGAYWPLSHWQVKPDLPEKYSCDGPCSDKFRTPYDAFTAHMSKCGSGTAVNPWSSSFISTLANRTVNEGCGRYYYDCPSVPDTEHKVLRCTKDYTESDGTRRTCRDRFRKCMYHKIVHNHRALIKIKSLHSASGGVDDSTSEVVDNSPNCDLCTGSCSACPITYACGNHSGSPSDSNGHRLIPATSWSLHCTTHSFYACDPANHAMTICTVTDSNGNTCTFGYSSPCESHTHVFPNPNLCPRSGCNTTITASNSADHALVPCTGQSSKVCGQSYYACDPNGANNHAWLVCTRNSCSYYAHNQSAYRIRRCKNKNPRSCWMDSRGRWRSHNLRPESQ